MRQARGEQHIHINKRPNTGIRRTRYLQQRARARPISRGVNTSIPQPRHNRSLPNHTRNLAGTHRQHRTKSLKKLRPIRLNLHHTVPHRRQTRRGLVRRSTPRIIHRRAGRMRRCSEKPHPQPRRGHIGRMLLVTMHQRLIRHATGNKTISSQRPTGSVVLRLEPHQPARRRRHTNAAPTIGCMRHRNNTPCHRYRSTARRTTRRTAPQQLGRILPQLHPIDHRLAIGRHA